MIDGKVYKLSVFVYALHQLFKGECLGYIRNFISQIIPYAIVSNVFGRILYLLVVVGIASVMYMVLKSLSKRLKITYRRKRVKLKVKCYIEIEKA